MLESNPAKQFRRNLTEDEGESVRALYIDTFNYNLDQISRHIPELHGTSPQSNPAWQPIIKAAHDQTKKELGYTESDAMPEFAYTGEGTPEWYAKPEFNVKKTLGDNPGQTASDIGRALMGTGLLQLSPLFRNLK